MAWRFSEKRRAFFLESGLAIFGGFGYVILEVIGFSAILMPYHRFRYRDFD
jgi:hypothetical protein